ncbi:Rv1355c family protein [Mycolicibacterium sp. 018/SC-01/001]|uniref:Rv1355c family protein n=1 Tax=Mycolicibacterium sp. 018/SC-01/001 TaxID=2592069 RepID=UPI00117D7DD0|nr:Rv1355c family protein [Mycolicibacterium sp. 018/SC-01/001]TRW81517.1 Rv1355c family protein [Mycolicibacterium sp. 018/SC-01/001]
MTQPAHDVYAASILDVREPEDAQRWAALHDDPAVAVVDSISAQRAELAAIRPAVPADLADEPDHWAYYPWRRALVRVLGPRAYRRLRLDRNRNLISAEEMARLGRVRVGVVGLSVGHAIAHTLATQGLCGELRLADFDAIDVSNLNRVPATLLDVGVNKAVVCARRLAELDPYLTVVVQQDGLTAGTVDDFLDGLDVLVEECDSLDAKVLVRGAARARRIPVLMATSSGGLLDVERFDTEPDRPLLHGLLGELAEMDAATLAGLSAKQKVPRVLRIIDASGLPARMAASLLEVGTTLSTWPQLSSEVAVGAASVAEAVRRIGLGEPLASGRVKVDVPALLDHLGEPGVGLAAADSDPQPGGQGAPVTPVGAVIDVMAAAAWRAPSGGNTQPWIIEKRAAAPDRCLDIHIDPDLTSAMDVGFRGSAVAVGAAAFNARVAAAAQGYGARVDYRIGDERFPLSAAVTIEETAPDLALAELYPAMLQRETNRHHGTRIELDDAVVTELRSAAADEGARLALLTDPSDVEQAAALLATADRIRYLTPHLHAQMIDELRWPGHPSPDTGIDVHSLELDDADVVLLDILRRGDVMAHLAAWDAGTVLGDDSRAKVAAAAGVAIITVTGHTISDYARAGAAVESVWIHAQQRGLAVQPVSPAFLYAADRDDFAALSPRFADALADLQYTFRTLVSADPAESLALVLRLSRAPRPSVISRRRGGNDNSSPS